MTRNKVHSGSRVSLARLLVLLVLLHAQSPDGGGWGHVGRVSSAALNAEAAERALRELRCELLCQYAEMQLQCDACRSRRPLRFGKRVENVAPTEPAIKPSGDQLAVTVSTLRGTSKDLPFARVQLTLPERAHQPQCMEQKCICCDRPSLACYLLSLSKDM